MNLNMKESLRKSAMCIPKGFTAALPVFWEEQDLFVRTATFDMEEHGLTEEVLQKTDVLIFWSHALQEEFSDEVAKRVREHVLSGMGLAALHSAHYSKIIWEPP